MATVPLISKITFGPTKLLKNNVALIDDDIMEKVTKIPAIKTIEI